MTAPHHPVDDRLSQIILGAEALHHLPARDRIAAFDALPEQARLGIVKGAGAVPDACGPELPQAPARGPLRVFDVLASYPDGRDGTVLKPAGFAGRRTAQRLDVFGRMAAQSSRRGGALGLTASQIGMGRLYATLVQTHAASGVRGISIESMSGARGGSQEGFTDHRLDQARRITLLQARVGDGAALALRRVRPSARGDQAQPRRNIADRVLVDLVCLEDLDISAVLARHGWSVKGDTVKAATKALAEALDRMIGPTVRPARFVIHYGQAPSTTFR